MILIEIKKEARYLNKPEQAIEHHNNPKEKMKIYKIRKSLKVIDLGQNRIPDKISPGKFLHPETPQNI